MKGKKKGCLVFLMAWMLSTVLLSETAYAADEKSVLKIKDLSGAYEVSPESQLSDSDLFPSFKEVMPGDTCRQEIEVCNVCEEKEDIRLYLTAVMPVYSPGDPDAPGKETDPLSLLRMKVWNGKTLLFDEKANLSISQPIDLGLVSYGSSAKLQVELEVPVELNNEQTERVAKTEWIFQVESSEAGSSTGSSHHSGASAVNTPQTGDGNRVEMWGTIVLLSLLTISYIFYNRFTGRKSW